MSQAKHFGTALALAFSVTATAAGAQIDQQHVPPMINGYGIVGASQQVHTAQTFTVGANGVLVGFDAWVTRHKNVREPLLFDIRKTVASLPADANSGADVLASVAVPADLIAISRPFDPPPGLTGDSAIIDLDGPVLAPESRVHVDLSAFGIAVSQGDILAIVLRSDDSNLFRGFTYAWHGTSPGAYRDGATYFRSTADNKWYALDDNTGSLSFDQAFRTYIQPIPEPRTTMLLIAGVLIALSDTFNGCCSYSIRRPSRLFCRFGAYR